MFITKTVEIKVTWSNIEKLKPYYIGIKKNDVINIDVEHLSNGSQLKIDFKCDSCGSEKSITYKDYIRFNDVDNNYIGYYICPNCKRNKSTIDKYGVNNISQLESVKKKKEDTNMINCGKPFNSQTEEYLDKCKKTNVERFGVEWSSQNINIRTKQIETNLREYGVDNPSKNRQIQDKIRQTNINTKRKTSFIKEPNLIDILPDNIFLLKCDNGHEFEINRVLYYKRKETNTILCTKCNPIDKNISGLEIELLSFIKSIYNGEIISNSKKIITPYEIDIYLPELSIAFEFNGVYWHNELNKPKHYHKTKTDLCEEQGIELFHIWEDDWLFKKDIVKSMIKNKLGITKNKIYARKCQISQIYDNNTIKSFLNNNHIQGYVKSSHKLGLYYNDELVSIMLFSKKNDEFELVRFCNKINFSITGGASKLLKNFMKNINIENKPIISFSDRMYSNGGLYYTLGFKLLYQTKINYQYVVNGIRVHKSNFSKLRLIKDGFDVNKSEHDIMIERGYYRVYNSGNLKFTM